MDTEKISEDKSYSCRQALPERCDIDLGEGDACSQNQCHYDRAESGDGIIDQEMVPVFDHQIGQYEYNKECRKYESDGSNGGACDTCHLETDISRGIDSQRPGGALGDGDDIREFMKRQPVKFGYHFFLDQGYHGVTAAKAKSTDEKEGIENLP